jgi:hypothetical protein
MHSSFTGKVHQQEVLGDREVHASGGPHQGQTECRADRVLVMNRDMCSVLGRLSFAKAPICFNCDITVT